MIFVGLMGGATYANCMYLFSTRKDIPNEYRELGMNLGFFFSNVGIIMATGFTTVIDETVLSKSRMYPPNGKCPGHSSTGTTTPVISSGDMNAVGLNSLEFSAVPRGAAQFVGFPDGDYGVYNGYGVSGLDRYHTMFVAR